jgi:hypothetical protein
MAKGKKVVFRIERVPLAKIERGGGTQARVGNNEDTVAEYTERLRAGKELPPPVVFKDATGKLWLADGFHRVEAHARWGKSRGIDVELHVGDQRAAVLYAAGANAHHGLRRSAEDKRRAIGMLLSDPEWRTWSDRAIADHCHVGHQLVAAVRGGQLDDHPVESRKSADGKTRDVTGIAESNRERAVERHSAATAGTLTPDAAPARPRVTREVVDEIPPDDVPDFEHEPEEVEDDEPAGGEVVEDGAMAEAPYDGLVDNEGTPVPGDLEVVWQLLHEGAAEVDRALNTAAHAWSRLQDQLLRHVRKVGTDAHLPSRFMPSVENDFGPGGRVPSMQALLRRMIPHVLCGNCEGLGCTRCDSLGWFSRVDWKERRRVDGVLGEVGVEE